MVMVAHGQEGFGCEAHRARNVPGMFFGAGTVSGRRVHKMRCSGATKSCTMRALSLNIWGVPNATHRHRRVRDFADMLQANADHYVVVCLQECFVA